MTYDLDLYMNPTEKECSVCKGTLVLTLDELWIHLDSKIQCRLIGMSKEQIENEEIEELLQQQRKK